MEVPEVMIDDMTLGEMNQAVLDAFFITDLIHLVAVRGTEIRTLEEGK